jgi:hypothetical protein
VSDNGSRIRTGAIEFALIVTSILLAFAIDAAWERRTESAQARELLTGLSAEFEFQRSELGRFRDRWMQVRRSTERLLEASSADTPPAPAVIDSLLLDVLNPSTFDPRTGTLQAATGSGQLGLIGSRDLRDKLAAWDGVVAEVRDNEVAMREFILSSIVPYLAEAGVPLARSWSLLPDIGLQGGSSDLRRWPGEKLSDREAATVYRRLLADGTFVTLVGARYTWINVQEYEEAIVFVDELLALIQADLAT